MNLNSNIQMSSVKHIQNKYTICTLKTNQAQSAAKLTICYFKVKIFQNFLENINTIMKTKIA